MSTKRNKYSKNSYFMKLAHLQALRVLGKTKENPAVGCAIVKNDNIISLGNTGISGRPHAEQNAINFSKENIKNSTLYVTLEPCFHFGKTPPCVNSIIKNEFKKVYISQKDPDPRTFKKSINKLKKKRILVKDGINSIELKNFYKSYFLSKKNSLPFVTSKLAVSKDWYTNNKKGDWITNKFSRGRVHLMRSNHDCVITTAKTILNDNPKLTCRIQGLYKHSPSRIILDRNLIVPATSDIIKTSKNHCTIFFFNKFNNKKIKKLKKFKIKVLKAPIDTDGKFDLKYILLKLKNLGFSRIFLESGVSLTNSFLQKDLVNDFQLFISNKKLNNNGSNSFKKSMKFFFKNKKFINEKVNLLGDKLLFCRIK